ncbi:histidine phosphatase family protein [Neobacillus sp. 19]|uniref:histidine phosphatase family protein n=1 Tax=Neobacillus sp. 19 TaxID=3394458 RepID=UPI003BF75F56
MGIGWRTVGLNDVKTACVGLGMQDGQAWIELVKFHTPSDEKGIQQPFANTLGIRQICFAVEDFIHNIGVVFLKRIYVIRHCEAAGQPPEAQLTDRGLKQAIGLCEFFSNIKIDRIISSPYKRAIESIQPLAKRLNIEVEIDSKLTERVLSTNSFFGLV